MRRGITAMLLAALMVGVAACSSPPEASTAGTASLAGLRRIPGTHMYAMTFTGDYDELAGVPLPPSAKPFGCSLFYATGDPGRSVFARNFDWDPNPALVLHTDPPDGYASVSIVDLFYLGVPAGVDPLTDDDARRRLLGAPLLPFDGMNDRGLVVGMAADESGRAETRPDRPTVGSVRILRLMLDRAATVEEALALIDRFNLDFDGGPPLHYLIADRSGASAVVEFVDGRRVVTRGGPRWHALTNFRLAGSDATTRQADRRYATAQATLTERDGVLNREQAFDVLRAVAQPHTQWSVTYQPHSGVMHVVARQDWSAVHEFTLPMART
ncbi:carcinine hydrolase/isopenicillin-N N-acyltransferase family protein [Actinoplanes sp. NPDC024001]|uniref:carcinine hydrolase/isopenicillin-N N-acyltransferase family protein n=1 Tax=Actinoplanes sp. NPDC024001 TaxID=3154598 RepID=UPI0033E1C8A4